MVATQWDPRGSPPRFVPPERAGTSWDTLLPHDGGWIRVREWGPLDRPAVVLVPIEGQTAAIWDPLIAILAPRWHLVAYHRAGRSAGDPPSEWHTGPGTPVGDLRQVIERLDLDRPILVARALDPLPAARYAVAFPDRVAGLAVVGERTFPPDRLLNQSLGVLRCPLFIGASAAGAQGAAEPRGPRPPNIRRLEQFLDCLLSPRK